MCGFSLSLPLQNSSCKAGEKCGHSGSHAAHTRLEKIGCAKTCLRPPVQCQRSVSSSQKLQGNAASSKPLLSRTQPQLACPEVTMSCASNTAIHSISLSSQTCPASQELLLLSKNRAELCDTSQALGSIRFSESLGAIRAHSKMHSLPQAMRPGSAERLWLSGRSQPEPKRACVACLELLEGSQSGAAGQGSHTAQGQGDATEALHAQ